jgi:hypothetical protein
MHAADAKIIATGHPPVFNGNWFGSVWSWDFQSTLRPVLLGIVGAALIAFMVRRTSKGPWFVFAAVLPVVVGHADRLHGWWAPGPGIDQWTFGAGVSIPGLDLSSYGAGPSWTITGGTLLAVAAVVVPALLARPVPQRPPSLYFLRALPYVVLMTLAAALTAGKLDFNDLGDFYTGREMYVMAGAAALFATTSAFVATDRSFWRHTAVVAVAAGLVTVSGLNPGAMSSTKWAAFAAAAGVAVIAAIAARRPNLRFWSARTPVRALVR